MWTVAPTIAKVYGDPAMIDLLRVLALTTLLSGIVATKVSLAQREMRFQQLASRDSLAIVFGGIAGISSALAGWGVWSLVVQTLSGAAISAAMTWRIVSWRPHRKHLSFKAVMDMSDYSVRMLLFGLLKIVTQNVDVMLIGYTMGLAMAGLYTLASKMIITPMGAVRGAFGAYFFPAFSRFQDNRHVLATEYERALKLIGYGCIPFLLIFYFFIDQFVAYGLPTKWINTAPVAKALTFVALLQGFIAISGELMKAMSRPGILIWWSLGLSASTAVAVVIGSHWGLVGIAVAIAVVHAIGLIICLSISVWLVTPTRWVSIFSAALVPVLMFLCIVVAGEFLVRAQFDGFFGLWIRLIVMFILSGIVIVAFRRQVYGWLELVRSSR